MTEQLQIIVCRGCPASGKSFWSVAKVAENPLTWVRQNNDEIRAMCNSSVYGKQYEAFIRTTRLSMIKEAIKANFNVVVDNVNANEQNWKDVLKIAKEANKDIIVSEKLFYEDIEVLLERNAKRTGSAFVPEKVIHKFYRELGGKKFKDAVPKVEVFSKRDVAVDRNVPAMVQDESLPRAVICDLDGTLAKIGDRSPYCASNCDLTDSPNDWVVETVKLYYNADYKIIFCSGRMDKDRAPTIRFIEKHLPGMKYVLLMREDADLRRDDIVKEEIFNKYIKPNYWTKLVIDDRLIVCRKWYEMGLNLFRAGDPDSSF